jgi:hypothetical protein
MDKAYLISLFFLFHSFYFFSQDEYVIDKPVEKRLGKLDSIPNPDYTNYLLNASAFTLKKGNIRLSSTDILFAKGSYGVTEKLTMSASISLVGTFIGSFKQQISLTEELKLAFSGSIGQLVSVPTDSVILFTGGEGMITLGDIQNNITFGVGYYYIKSSFNLIDNEREFFVGNIHISTQKQLRKRVYLIGEGMYFGQYNVFSGSIGLKVIIKTNMTLGFGIMPIAWKDRNFSKSKIEGGALPILTFRMLFD